MQVVQPASVAQLANALVVLSSTAEDGEIEHTTPREHFLVRMAPWEELLGHALTSIQLRTRLDYQLYRADLIMTREYVYVITRCLRALPSFEKLL
uniref:(California timema) hypothetical protein n=1 Tax=Timema californicum TaxID=61474 RepID=A0A7R9IZG2_TIMCA|nr:unnamed protein product [Timema californicum]